MSKTIKLRSADDKIFEVDEPVARMSLTIKNMLDGHCSVLFFTLLDLGDDDTPIPIPNVSAITLGKVTLLFIVILIR
jgi:hypothetical protein